MPELPEVEVVRLGLTPHILHQKITAVLVRQRRLRFLVPADLNKKLQGKTILTISRRGKYLLFETTAGTLIWHLGMTGSLRILTEDLPPRKHDHIDLVFANHCYLRFNDPRRFGSLLLTEAKALDHPLLAELGPEPLTQNFNPDYLWKKAQKRNLAIKNFLMNSKIVVGVGNIYAAEALFLAKLHPQTPASKLSHQQYKQLCLIIKRLLRKAIRQGGTTVKDFVNSEGKPGYFKQKLHVYGRGGLPCLDCGTKLEHIRLGQRGTVFCPHCQSLSHSLSD